MGFVSNYKKNKDLYSDKDIFKIFYSHYYYIVDSTYIKHNGEINKDDIEACLNLGINDYITKNDNNPSRYIHNRIVSLEKSYQSKKNKKEYYELLNYAYQGNIEAKKMLFFKHIDKIDKRVIEIYEMYLNVITLDSITNYLYQEMWDFVNRYFESDNKGYYFSTRFSNQLNSTCDKLIRHINNTIGCKVKVKKKGRG